MAAELFGDTDVPKIVGLPDLRSQDLTAEEGFLLSRIDGRTNVRGLLALVSWDKGKTLALLENLLRKHLVNFERAEIYQRINPTGGSAPVAGPNTSVKDMTPEPAKSGIDRASIEKVADLDEDRCMEILEWHAKVVKAASLYELFAIPDGADVRSVKREYRGLAMRFHPDKFFRKEIGGYRTRIEEAWKKIQEAYEKLTDAAQKTAYDAEILSKPKPRATIAPAAAQAPGKPWMAPPAPPSASATGAGSQPLPEIPDAESRPKFESAFERKIKQEVRERLEKSQRHFAQAKQDYADKKYVSADSNVKLAMQFDPKSEELQRWYESVKKPIEEHIVAGLLGKGEMLALSQEMKGALESYEHAVLQFPDNVDANRALGVYLMKIDENPKRARDCLQKATNAKPKDIEALVAYAKSLRLMGMVKNAQRVLDQAKALDGRDVRVLAEAKELKKA